MPRSRSSPPPPPPHSRRPKHGRGRAEATLDATAIDAALAPTIPDPRDRAFVLRCITNEGPRHHRLASWALLRMLAAVLTDLGGAAPSEDDDELAPLPIRLPPSVEATSDDAHFPIGLATKALRRALDDDETASAVDALRDGPAHHALANAVMVAFIGAIHRRVKERR